MKIDDAAFTRALTLADAYKIMFKFIEQYNARGESSTAVLLSDLSLSFWADGGSADPAQLSDFLAVATAVLGPQSGPAVA